MHIYRKRGEKSWDRGCLESTLRLASLQPPSQALTFKKNHVSSSTALPPIIYDTKQAKKFAAHTKLYDVYVIIFKKESSSTFPYQYDGSVRIIQMSFCFYVILDHLIPH